MWLFPAHWALLSTKISQQRRLTCFGSSFLKYVMRSHDKRLLAPALSSFSVRTLGENFVRKKRGKKNIKHV